MQKVLAYRPLLTHEGNRFPDESHGGQGAALGRSSLFGDGLIVFDLHSLLQSHHMSPILASVGSRFLPVPTIAGQSLLWLLD